MTTTKSLLQRVQSRISKRRDMIHAVENMIDNHYYVKSFWGVGTMTPEQLKHNKASIKAGAESQQLDKKIFQMLVEKERNKLAGHFRSKYPHWRATVGFGEAA